MLDSELLDIINSGNAWAFVGSGPSIDSGLPAWADLLTALLDEIPQTEATESEAEFSRLLNRHAYPQAFQLIEDLLGRDILEARIKSILRNGKPGAQISAICDLPFAGYLTTNYDTLLHDQLRNAGTMGWVSVGNTPNECRKISGDVQGVVWHIHGSVAHSDASRLILTEDDYDNLYLENSTLQTQLRSLLAQRRVIFFGFGFNDPELLRILKKVKKVSNPARPAFAFLGRQDRNGNTADRRKRLFKENIRTIPYTIQDGSHSSLLRLLETYSSFALRRSMQFNSVMEGPPTYDPDTTSLLLYNHLALGRSRPEPFESDEALHLLLKSRVLSLARFRPNLEVEAVVDELSARASQILGIRVDNSLHLVVHGIIETLKEENLIDLSDADPASLHLTQQGEALVENNAANAELRRQKFQQSIQDRCRALLPSRAARQRLVDAVERFLEETIRRRALGVALALSRPDVKEYHILALLQELPRFMGQLANMNEAASLSRLTRHLLSAPTSAERSFIGLMLQAQFGLHLLGYHADSSAVRCQLLRKTLYIVDSNTLIPLIAAHSLGQDQARFLLRNLRTIGAVLVTTDQLLKEVIEHADWALSQVRDHRLNLEALVSLRRSAGGRINAFLEGFARSVAVGENTDFLAYLHQAVGTTDRYAHDLSSAIHDSLREEGVVTRALSDWEGFSQDDYGDRAQIREEIATRRRVRGSYKHDRQVSAEAEALIVVRKVRSGEYSLEGVEIDDAYFISHTRAIDEVDSPGRPITVRPESLIQLLETLSPSDDAELGLITDNFLTELEVLGLVLVEDSSLKIAFSPLVDASKRKLGDAVIQHRELIAEMYGESAVQAFSEVSDLEAPIVVEGLGIQLAEKLAKKLEEEKALRQRERFKIQLSDKERVELERLRAEKKQRKAKADRKRRRAASMRGLRRGRRGKK